MKYSKELRNLVIKNLIIIEAASDVVVDVESDILNKINKKCKNFAKKMSWSFDKSHKNDDGVICFYPDDWIIQEPDKKVCGYWFWFQESEDRSWLSLLFGLYANEFAGFQFDILYSQLNVNKPTFRKYFLELFDQEPKLKELGFLFEDHYLMLPFYVDQDELISDPKTALLSVDNALEKIKEAHPILQSIKEKIIEKYD